MVQGKNGEVWVRVNDKPEWAVSSFGRVIRICDGGRYKAGHFIKFRPINKVGKCSTNGYLGTVSEDVNGNSRMFILHRLVSEAFLGPCPPGFTVDHLDTNKMNCAASNLEYVTLSENCLRARRMGLNVMQRKFTQLQIREIRAKRLAGSATKVLANEYRTSYRYILAICDRSRYSDVN
jgi:hypothetical protein